MPPRKSRGALTPEENRKKVHSLVRWFMREGKEAHAAKLLLAMTSEAERKRVAKALGEMIADDNACAARRVDWLRKAVAERDELLANGGRLN